ncbi:MAG: bifunctional 3,4-dihydroxy-2-butanone-4-phosphate synthase/GTP cyclohydrolase II [Candidatus Neomarinimicrobiota bacterium]
MKFDSIKSAINEIRNGQSVIIVDDADRENEGDIVMASELITPDAVNFMAKYARGLICVSISKEQAEKLSLNLMEKKNTGLHETNFTISIDKKNDTTTGISAFDRSKTIRALVDEKSKSEDFARPGHIFPIIGKKGGVLRRAGHTEASMDLAQMAGLKPSGVICEIMAEDGDMLRGKDLESFAKRHNLKLISIEDLIRYKRKTEKLISRLETVDLPTDHGKFEFHLYESEFDNKQHIALTHGNYKDQDSVLTRVHSECLTGDVFLSKRCDCGIQLKSAMKAIVSNGSGAIIYLKQEGRGIGLKHKIKAYKLQESGLDTVEANVKLGFPPDMRDYGVGAQILKDLGIKKLKVITNNPKKLIGLEGHGLEITERVKIKTETKPENERYLSTKKSKLGHMLDL